jgi:hypothetical protein
LFFKTVRPESREVAQLLNTVTGGNEDFSGWLDVSPEVLDNAFDYLAGGFGRFVMNAVTTAGSSARGETPEVRYIPFLRRFYSLADNARFTSGKYFEYVKTFDKIMERDKRLVSVRESATATAEEKRKAERELMKLWEEEYPQYWDVADELEDTEKRIKALRKDLKRTEAVRNKKDANEINAEMEIEMMRILGLFKDAEERHGK